MKTYEKPDLRKLIYGQNDVLKTSTDNFTGWKWGDSDLGSSGY